MNTPTIFSELLSTSQGALFMGICLTVGALSSALSIGYYSIFRVPALLYFALSVAAAYLSLGIADPDPLHVLHSAVASSQLQQVLSMAGIFFFYKVIRASFLPAPALPFPVHTFDALAAVLLLVRIFRFFDHNPLAIKASSMLGVLFLAYAGLIALTFPSATSTMRLIKVGCAVPTAIVMTYPLVRSGVIAPDFFVGKMAFIMMGALTLHSALWFVALVELAREAREKAQRKMAQTLVHLHDFIEGPLDTIQSSVATLHRGEDAILPILHTLDKSVDSLRLMKLLLSRFEKNLPEPRSKMNDGA